MQHRGLDVNLQSFRWNAVWACRLSWLQRLGGLGDLSLAGRVGIDVKELGWWWDVWWCRWGGSVERFLDVFRPSWSLLLLASYGVSVLNFDRAAGVSVLSRESSGDLVEPLHVSLVFCSLCLCCQLLYLSSFVFPGTFFTSMFFSQYRACSFCFSSVACVWLIWSFKFFLSVMSFQVSDVIHSLCFLVFLPKTFVHVAFQVFCRLCHWSSIVFSGSKESKLNLFLTSILNSSDFCSSLRHCTLNLIDGRPALSLDALSLVLRTATTRWWFDAASAQRLTLTSCRLRQKRCRNTGFPTAFNGALHEFCKRGLFLNQVGFKNNCNWGFCNVLFFFGTGLLAPGPTPNLEGQWVLLVWPLTFRPVWLRWPYQETNLPPA